MEPIELPPEVWTLKDYVVAVAKSWDKSKLYEVLRRYSPQQAWEAAIQYSNDLISEESQDEVE